MTEPRHGDPFDFADIPGDSGLSEAYRDSMRTPAMREAIAKRQAYLKAEREKAAIAKRRAERATPAAEKPPG